MFFGTILEAGKQYEQEPDLALHLSMATIQPSKQTDGPIVSVFCHSEDGKFLICSLDPAKNYQVPLDLTFIEGQTVTLSMDGPGKVHITGYYMPEPDLDFDDESASDLDEEVESDMDEDEAVPEVVKRQAAAVAGPPPKKAKTGAAQTPAKGKANGQAAKPVTPAVKMVQDDDDEDDEEDDDESDESDLNKLLEDIKKQSGDATGKKEGGGGDKKQVSGEDGEDEEDDDDDDVDDEEEGDMDEEDDETELAAQQKQLKQTLQSKPQNGQSGGKGMQQQQQQKGNKPHFAKQHQNAGSPNKGGNWQKGGQGKFNQQRSPGSGFRGGRGRGGGGGRGRGGGGGRGGGAGGTPYNKNRNFSPHGNSHQKGKGKTSN